MILTDAERNSGAYYIPETEVFVIEDGKTFNLDDEVENFINKVKIQKATVSDLTPHILKWLKANDLMNTMKVRF